ncbi:MAG: cupin domain-containing protein [Xanthomonadales bacterium]|nr:cupin domain-containing protein [Xanthomonadales bacterium]NIN58884.1 cupin domain-containing protein [Xanthomonadales bacterium]NIN74153.1 cupin domain-containing protein [Xanthomonadales bacterium]NIO13824.1 cupin domain-containing protein [Xanthomonadales bacterium]NIP11277.1 cupin domain-containing protein [Xanthomonadales bacterium]
MSGPVARAVEADEYYFEEGCFILELHNDPDDPGLSIARARVPAGTATAWHRLRGTTERYVILAGRGEAWVGDQGPLAVAPGDVVAIPPMVGQRIRNTGDDDLVFLALCTPRFERDNYVPGD